MNMRILSHEEISRLASILQPLSLEPVIQAVADAGGVVYLVGGAVRDLLLQLPIKDLDFEVHNLNIDELKKVLSSYGPVSLVGKSFGVLKFRAKEGCPEVDWSLPRRDSTGRKPEVEINPMMTIDQALRRRDLTINAMAVNMLTKELVDPFGGEEDLRKGILRCPDENTFSEDPLRFFRVMQFMGRFGYTPDRELNSICSKMNISTVSCERIEEELRKLLLKSNQPSTGFRWLLEMDRLAEVFPEIGALVDVPQTPVYHPEGNVFEHTMQVVDAAAQLREQLEVESAKLALMYGALCHDLGKAKTTVEHEDGRISSYGHEVEGSLLAGQLLKRVGGNKEIMGMVKKLVLYHMIPGQLMKSSAKMSAYKRLAVKLAPETNGQMLALLFEADRRGRNGEGKVPLNGPIEEAEQFLEKMSEAEVALKPEEPILQGRDFLDVVGPGPMLGQLVKKAYEIQIEEGIRDKDMLKKKALE